SGLAVQAMRAGERRLVARLGAPIFQHLEQGRLLAADVATGADEDRDVERGVEAGQALVEEPAPSAIVELAFEDLSLALVLVADVDDPAPGPRDDLGQHHALDDEVGSVLEDEAILDRARLALVSVADDEFLRPRRAPHDLPLEARRKAGATHPAETARL